MGYEQFKKARNQLNEATSGNLPRVIKDEKIADALKTLGDQVLKPDAVTARNALKRAKLFSRIINNG